jgi:hypothetical protein
MTAFRGAARDRSPLVSGYSSGLYPNVQLKLGYGTPEIETLFNCSITSSTLSTGRWTPKKAYQQEVTMIVDIVREVVTVDDDHTFANGDVLARPIIALKGYSVIRHLTSPLPSPANISIPSLPLQDLFLALLAFFD